MKLIFLKEMICRFLDDRQNMVISVPDYKFLSEWESGLLGEVCKTTPIAPYLHVDDASTGELVEAAYFKIPGNVSDETMGNLARFMSVRLFVSSPREGFFDNIPPIVQEAVFYRGKELDAAILDAATSMSGFKWMALRDGDEGDAYYYLFE
jgi:hypothetical protein